MITLTGIQSRLNQIYKSGQYSDSLITSIQAIAPVDRTDYCHVAFSDDTTMIANGATQMYTLSSWGFYDGAPDYDFSHVSEDAVQNGITTLVGDTCLLMLDIEHFLPEEIFNPALEYDAFVTNLGLAASMWQAQTARTIGFYEMIPRYDNYAISTLKWAIDNTAKATEIQQRSAISSWMRLYDQSIADLGQYVDYLCPRCYVLYSGNQVTWRWIVTMQILEAIRIAGTRPVYPIIWYRAATDEVPLTKAEFTSALQYVSAFPGIAGVFVWSGPPEPVAYDWRDVVKDMIDGTGDFEV